MTVGAVAAEHPALEQLASVVEGAVTTAAMLSPQEIWTCPDASVDALLRMHAQLESVTAAIGHLIVRDADVRDLAGTDGMKSTQRWLAARLNLTQGEAKARVKTAEMLCRTATDTLTAVTEGRINPDQAHAIAKGLDKIEPHASAAEFAGAERFLLRKGPGLHAGHIARLAKHIREVLDPDGKEPKEKARAQRGVTITDLGDGLHRIKGQLTDECAAHLKAALDPLAAPRPAVKGPNANPG